MTFTPAALSPEQRWIQDPATPLLIFADFDRLSDDLRRFSQNWLDDHERSRYQGFNNADMADCFLIGRALVKHFYAGILGCLPEEVQLTLSGHGKPGLDKALAVRLQGDSTAESVIAHFSISHKESELVVAVSSSPVGVDLETVVLQDKMKVARRFFTIAEADVLESLPPVQRAVAFTQLWTLKEAEVKRKGATLPKIMGQVAFHVDSKHIRCQGAPEGGYYRLFRVPDSGCQKLWVALATSGQTSGEVLSIKGLPVSGFSDYPLVAEAVSV